MVVGSYIPESRLVSAHFDAIKYGVENDILPPNTMLFYGDADKATLITARNSGKVLAIKAQVRRSGR